MAEDRPPPLIMDRSLLASLKTAVWERSTPEEALQAARRPRLRLQVRPVRT